MKKLSKAAVFTDIHFGGRSNSQSHNQDCSNFITWFIDNVKQDPEIDHIMFLGDWFDNRSSINVETLNNSYLAAKKLNQLGLPIFFIVGNHDIYHRHTRDIYSSLHFEEFKNFRIIDHPQVIEEIADSALVTPYLFHKEYSSLAKYRSLKTWWGHFEFKGFVITGSGIRMFTGPNGEDFAGPKFIFSGHFHKRQLHDNIVYIGNTFPTNFNDAGDNDRGMMVFDHRTNDIKFINWDECPKFIKIKLTDILNDQSELLPNARVKCEVDVPINFEEASYFKSTFCKKFRLREMILEESPSIQSSLVDTEITDDGLNNISVDDMIIRLLQQIDNEKIDNEMLVKIYRGLRID